MAIILIDYDQLHAKVAAVLNALPGSPERKILQPALLHKPVNYLGYAIVLVLFYHNNPLHEIAQVLRIRKFLEENSIYYQLSELPTP